MKANQGDFIITLGGKKLKFKDEDAVPRMSDKGLPMIPTDLIAAKLGVHLALIEGTIQLTHGSKKLVARIGNINMELDGKDVRAEGLPFIQAGRMYLPAVQCLTLLGFTASFDSASNTLTAHK